MASSHTIYLYFSTVQYISVAPVNHACDESLRAFTLQQSNVLYLYSYDLYKRQLRSSTLRSDQVASMRKPATRNPKASCPRCACTAHKTVRSLCHRLRVARSWADVQL